MTTVERQFSDSDFPRLFDLLLSCQDAGYVDMELSSTNLRLNLTNPAFSRRHTLLLETDGQLHAFALLWQARYLGMLVHPSQRGRLEADVLAWAERTLATADDPHSLVVLTRDDDSLMVDFCENRGYRVIDEELRMGRALHVSLPEFPAPPGFEIRARRGDAELDAWLELYSEAFGPRSAKLRHWRAMRNDPDHQPGLDLVAVTGDGKLAGMCYCSIAGSEAARAEVVEGRTEPVAVGRQFQRRGLGRALVTAGLIALREHGAQRAALTTEVDNVDAHRLYASLGYRELYRARWYQLPGGDESGTAGEHPAVQKI